MTAEAVLITGGASGIGLTCARQAVARGVGVNTLMFNGVNNLVPPNLGPYSPNLREVRAAGPVALGGIGLARSTAYAKLAWTTPVTMSTSVIFRGP